MTNPLLPQDEKITSFDEIRLNIKQTAVLARHLSLHDDDEEAQALLALVCGLAYEPEMTQRDNLAHAVIFEVYRYTADAGRHANKFIMEGWQAFAHITTPKEGRN